MDIKKLQYFMAVAECGSFTKAAIQLRIAQPALSRQIALLEKEFGVELLLRMGRHVRLTDAGEVLLKHAHEITSSFQRARDEMQSRGRSPRGRVIFGAPPSLGSIIVPKLFERIATSEAEITLQVREGNTSFLERAIVDAELDIALLGEDPAGQWIEGRSLATEEIAFVGRRGVLTKIVRNGPRAWNGVPIFVTRQVHQLCTRLLQDAEVGYPEVLEFDAFHGIKTLVLSGRGVTLTPVGIYSSDIAAGILGVAKATGVGMTRPLVSAWSSVRPQPRALEAVANALAEEVAVLANLGVFSIADSAPTIKLPAKSG